MICYSSRDYRNRKICLFLLLLLLRFLLFRLTSILPSFYFKRLVRTEFFESQTTMIFTQFAVNAFVIIALSSPSWGRAVSAQEPERARIYSSKEEASSVLEDGRDSLDPDSDPLAGMNDDTDVRKLDKKSSKKEEKKKRTCTKPSKIEEGKRTRIISNIITPKSPRMNPRIHRRVTWMLRKILLMSLPQQNHSKRLEMYVLTRKYNTNKNVP